MILIGEQSRCGKFTLNQPSTHRLRYIVGQKCIRTSSFGSLQLFREDQQPKEANGALRCVSCPIKRECVYSADVIYGDMARNNQTDQWPLSVAMNENGVTIEDVLETGPYGRCVYHCDNDVVDQQVVLMEFETGVTATFSMVAHTKDIVSRQCVGVWTKLTRLSQCVRKTRIFGSLGEIECVDGRSIVLTRHGGESESIEFDGPPANTHLRGHHGADYYLAKAFFDAVRLDDASLILSGPQDTLESHRAVFCAERARLEKRVVDL